MHVNDKRLEILNKTIDEYVKCPFLRDINPFKAE